MPCHSFTLSLHSPLREWGQLHKMYHIVIVSATYCNTKQWTFWRSVFHDARRLQETAMGTRRSGDLPWPESPRQGNVPTAINEACATHAAQSIIHESISDSPLRDSESKSLCPTFHLSGIPSWSGGLFVRSGTINFHLMA